ncbi:hypothetical protein MPTK1_7g15110 [Marchantia polymorpha subsp. ruderalis]|uniref:Uncharacterized GPI-anchored protein At5g19230-like domain-containing protein n=2 Tax=Marchantia polymorpha TaxID=3197 RepID=A0AAF6BZS4_MARPO|nr:hypothetical protein MARPO_0009s0195 [Marchantia polymorpha]BBN17508.1 hypothetical protein Mp_7g15110 [Marchantia polymorpha subsp. ruderalis]|eukprot:PTQ47114.1 hypothetical protein MARPO_0009s0195 [Marchantia polymorpha]
MAGNNVALLCISLLLLAPAVFGHDDDYTGMTAADTEVFNMLNEYRTRNNLSALTLNTGAACVAHGVAHEFQDIPCSNTTGADTPFGQNPQIPDYQDLLDDCNVDLANVKSGFIAPNCVPTGSFPAVAAMNITSDQQYQAMLNDSTYTSGGVGSSGVWYVMVLATSQPDGNFGTTTDFGSDNGQDSLQASLFISFGALLLSMVATL